MLWIFQHDENRIVDFCASRLGVPHYKAIHLLREGNRLSRRAADSVALSPVELDITLDKTSTVGGDCNLRTGAIRYNPASWFAVAVRWLQTSIPAGVIDESELAFLVTCSSVNRTVVHEVLHKFVRAQSTSRTPQWFEDLCSIPVAGDALDEFEHHFRCFRYDYEESAAEYLESALEGSMESLYTMLLTEALVAGQCTGTGRLIPHYGPNPELETLPKKLIELS